MSRLHPPAGPDPVHAGDKSGGVESLVSIPVLTSHAMISAELRARMGVTEPMVRPSVGIASVDDLMEDL